MSCATDVQNHLQSSGDFCALVDATGRIIASSTQVAASANTDRVYCHQLLTLHRSCPCKSCHIRRAIETGRTVEQHLRHPRLGAIQLRVQPLSGGHGRERLAALHIATATQAGADLARQALSSLPLAIFESDLQGRLLYANAQCMRQCALTNDDLSDGINLLQLVSAADRQRLDQLRQRALAEGGRQTADFTAASDGAQNVPIRIHLVPVKSRETITALHGMIEDLAPLAKAARDLRESEQRCQLLTRHDQLTGLPNRTRLMEWLGQALVRNRQEGKPLAVMLLDIDRFKQVVDSLGDACGDRVLCEIARRLGKKLRRNDMLARLNGDEFILTYGNVSRPENLSQLAQRLLKELQIPILLDEHVVYLTASIGIVTCRAEDQDGARLLRQAAIAMNEAKQQGGNQYIHFQPQMQQNREATFLFERHMREGLERREFYLHYQPQIDLESGRICGVEALVRWAGPDGGCPSPETFIKVAEDSGLIHPLGDFILHEACAQNLRWQQSGLPPIQVTVNISAKQFGQPDFVDKVLRTLEETGLAPQWLELEITESAIMDNIHEAIDIIRCLQQAGVQFAIDDFGTGHSSLNYLRQLSLSKLKIDRSFVHDIPGNRDNEKLVFSILALARSFDLQTVAEGIETPNQLAFLQQLECDLGQGYLFSRPVAAEAIPALLTAGESV